MRLLSLAVLLLTGAGCSLAVEEGGAGEIEGTSVVQGNVSVERTDAVGSGTSSRTHVSARFVRVSGGIDQQTAERVVGSALPLDLDAPEGCAWQEPIDSAPAAANDGSIELLDLGDIVVRAGSRTILLATRAFPDVGDLVSGVVYTSRDHSTELPEASTYSIDTASFSVEVDAPAMPTGVFVSQPSLSRLGVDRLFLDGSELPLTAGEDLVVGWEPGSASQGDRVYLELATYDDQGGASVLRCVFEDDGLGLVPASFNVVSPGSDVDLAVHRHRRASVSKSALSKSAPGPSASIDDAVVVFDFAVAARAAMVE
jgi:hypothetical protein